MAKLFHQCSGIVIRNFEVGFISEDEFVELLDLFGKSPDDFGLIINAVIGDLYLK